jgi:uncharacterized protein (TIGR03435 family)
MKSRMALERRSRCTRAGLALAACAVWAAVLHGQQGVATSTAAAQAQNASEQPLPAFDVVSVKPHKDEGMNMRMAFLFSPDGVTVDGMPLDHLLRSAFDLPGDRILNQPEWVKSGRYDIEAKVAPEDAPKLKGLTNMQRAAMLIPIFEDRFGLKFHHETREMEVYTLEVAKGGAKLKEATPDELAAGGPPPDPGKPGADNKPRKGMMMMRMGPEGVTLQATASTVPGLIRMLSNQIGGTVVDKTGLTGTYDYTLSFMPDQGVGPMMGPANGAGPDEGKQAPEPVGPSIFTAVQEQLGLKLVAQKEKVDVIVIDHIEQPSAN